MKIDPSRLPAPGMEPKNVSAPTTTPAAPAPVPLPYPNTGDSFEKVSANRLGTLLGGPGQVGRAAGELPAVQRQLATEAGALLSGGDAAGSMAAWTNAVAKDPGTPVLELLVHTMQAAVADMNADKGYFLKQLSDHDAAAEEISRQLGLLSEASETLAQQEARGDGSVRPETAAAGGAVDPNALVQHVLRESYLQTTEDLKFYAEKVKAFNEAKKELRQAVAEVRGGAVEAAAGLRGGSAVEAEIAKWEEKLAGVGDDAQLANVDLQNVLQKQQQVLQMMSNISKMLYDTAESVIRKMGG